MIGYSEANGDAKGHPHRVGRLFSEVVNERHERVRGFGAFIRYRQQMKDHIPLQCGIAGV